MSLRDTPIIRAPFLLTPLIAAAVRLALVLSAIIVGVSRCFPATGTRGKGLLRFFAGTAGSNRRHVRFAV